MIQPEIVKLEIPKSAKFISVARKATECIGSRAKLTDSQVGELKLAVGEACTNAVKYGDPESNSVFVQYSISTDHIEIEVTNNGPEFTWHKHEPVEVPIRDLQEGGLGMYLIEQVMDNIQIKSEHGVTAIKMTKML